MKKQLCSLVVLLLFSLAIFNGCSDGPANPITAPTTNQTPEFVKLPKRLNPSLAKTVSVTQFIYAAQGGTLRLQDSYAAAPDSHIVTLDIALKFKPNDLPYDASLTISIDDEAFITTVGMTFGPHGLVFNNPAKLTVDATGLDLGSTNVTLKLYYLNESNVWERMPASNAVYHAGTIDAHGKLPHLSQYAFGR